MRKALRIGRLLVNTFEFHLNSDIYVVTDELFDVPCPRFRPVKEIVTMQRQVIHIVVAKPDRSRNAVYGESVGTFRGKGESEGVRSMEFIGNVI